ncbi:MAG: LysM peptidoglycan-binding domain-containing protein [Actinomycetota bacterium]|nr:LysM peptidoglycan-binding domain-containing protein [Actinomycetota bacterium]
MVAVLTDSRHRVADDDVVRPRLEVIVPGAGRRPVVGSTARCRQATPTVSPRVAANRRLAVLSASLTVALVSVLLGLQAALGGGAGGPLITDAASAGAPQPAVAHSWVVRPGDTLWSIAVSVRPHGDVRPFVDRLSAEVGARPLEVGQLLTLP